MELNLTNKLTNLNFDNVKFNNRLAYLINFLSVLIFLFCGAQYIVKNWFTVDKIVIEGNLRHITINQLSYIAHNRLHGTFFTLNIGEMKSEFEKLPWVRKVSLERDFPHTVTVHLEERNAIARIGDSGFIADDGSVFNGADDSLNLPNFYVDMDYIPLALAHYRQIESFLAVHDDNVNSLWLTRSKITRFLTAKNLTVIICDGDLTNKLDFLGTNWDKIHKLNPNLKSINFCYKNAFAMNAESNL